MNKREEEKLKKQQERLEKEIARTKAMSTFEKNTRIIRTFAGLTRSDEDRWQVRSWQEL